MGPRLEFYGLPLDSVLTKWILSFLLNREGSIQTWVDLGSGNGEVLRRIGTPPLKGLTVDIYEPLLPVRGFSFFSGTIGEFFENPNFVNYVNLSSMFDVIEHFEKEAALRLLSMLEARFSTQIISTPCGFLKQDGETSPELADKPFMWHRCGFIAEEFEHRGYMVFVLKRYHQKPSGHTQNFDAMLAFKNRSFSERDYDTLAQDVQMRYKRWLLHPRNGLKSLRVRLGIPFRQSRHPTAGAFHQ